MDKDILCHDVYLGLGTNLGDKEANIHRAIDNIKEKIGKVISLSAFYATAPVGFDSDNMFLNAACRVQTHLQPLEILEITKTIEKEMGRNAKSQDFVYADRVIDIDVLMYDNLVLHSPQLILPHPFLQQRLFVLAPLAEIAPDMEHPVLKKTIKELKSDYEQSHP